ncbi:LysR family transcriptional regulator [Kordiimonas sp. SCSIO 12610]|uniref:LysR family transcriptional regulator n=1 Tax=Kordiimonas sp. SCSIO 12610 TaxID=2829597 RepID=UPI00210C08AE|nr:LysR family transcriptional regulator [Kordiimonas sp. SCSIO 12610]UTW56730.1 LysR family transcriptional regulator [Kordiimonas sp. SCSIO 12610]
MLSWDDLKYFLAMAEHGSLSATAPKLNVSQPTLSRRLTALEETVGAELFARTRNGLELTGLGEQLIDHIRHMSDDVHAIERLITGRDEALKGSVVVSAIEIIGAEWLVKCIRPFRDKFPGITVEVKVENNTADLLRREADIAMRMFRPEQNDLIAKKTVTMNYGFYASKDYIERKGKPESLTSLNDHDIILPHDEMLAYTNTYSRKNMLNGNASAFRSNNMLALSTAVREGYGIGAYSCFLASKDENLVRLFDEHVVFSADIWLVSHADLKRSARIRAMFDYLNDMLIEHRDAFAGKR